jgi:phenylpropionate dioxygenase-like ring-hydroxylating dioxygenase large terminal subunit
MTDGGIDAILSGIRESAALPMESSVAISTRSYRSAELYEMEIEQLFRKGWILIGRDDQVTERNSWVPVDVAGESLMMTRDSEGEFHVFSRFCPHRGAELVSEAGKASVLVCPYHAWSFDLSGRCRAAPLMREVPGFDRGQHGLKPIRHETWLGFVFVNLSADAAALSPRLEPLAAQLEDCQIGDYAIARSVDWGEMPFDWKILGENSMECYHHVGAHSGSIGRLFPAERSWTEDETDDYVLTVSAPGGDADGGATAIRSVTDAARIVTVFPNGHFTARPGGGTLVQVFPTGAGRSRVFSHIMVPRETLASEQVDDILKARVERMERVLGEDWDICRRVQNSATSSNAGRGRLSAIEQPLWLFYRYLARTLDRNEPDRSDG